VKIIMIGHLLQYNKHQTTARASVLVLVLIVVAAMTVLAVSLAYRTRIELRLAGSCARRSSVYYLAVGGLERILVHLAAQSADDDSTAASETLRLCTLNTTAGNEGLFDAINSDSNEGQILSYAVRDEQGYLNINRSDPAIWLNLQILKEQQAAAILDWLDTDSDTNPDGAETDYYERLQPSYVTKNKPCTVIKELLYIKHITPSIYLGEDRNHDLVLDDNERDGQQQRPFDNGDNNLDLGLVDTFTVYGTGRININTASAAVLAALPGLDETAADAIVTFRTEDDTCIQNAEDLTSISALTELQVELLEQYCCYDSQYFRMFSYARIADGTDCSLMATAKRTDNDVQILYVEQLP